MYADPSCFAVSSNWLVQFRPQATPIGMMASFDIYFLYHLEHNTSISQAGLSLKHCDVRISAVMRFCQQNIGIENFAHSHGLDDGNVPNESGHVLLVVHSFFFQFRLGKFFCLWGYCDVYAVIHSSYEGLNKA